MNNPLLSQHELPPFDLIKPEHIVPAIESRLASNLSQIDALLDGLDIVGEASWSGLVSVIEEMDDELQQAYSAVSHMNAVVNSKDLREAYNACRPKLSEYSSALGQNIRLYKAYQSIAASPEYAQLEKTRRKALDNALRDFRLSGIDLSAADQQRFAAINKRLAALSGQFNDNVLDATMAWSKLITDVSELPGLPPSALAQAKQRAEQLDMQGYLLTLEFPSYSPVMSYCENAVLRREMYEAYVTRASDQGPHAGQWDNSAVMHEILSLEKEKASLLGHENFAALSLATKMAESTDQVLGFLDQLATHAKGSAVEEFAQLCDFARITFGAATVDPWDVAFFGEKLKESLFSVSEETLRPYFPAPTVIQGMFKVVHQLFDLEIVQVNEITTWHPDVTTYQVSKNGEVIARFYLDLYARSAKQGGAWMAGSRIRRRRNDGSLQLPVAYLTCNFSSPVGDQPALLTHNEVVTLFHEFGHGLHHMLTRVECADVSGINGVAWDAVELPSQFMENWCWEPQALAFISGHHETGEPLPAALLDKIMAAKNFQSAMMMVRQVEFSLFDFRLRCEFDPQQTQQIQSVLDDVRAQVAVIQAAPFNRFQHGFGHIFGGGYAAGYYSYKWAEVLSADAFSRFKADGIFNRQTGERFLSSVLEQGGSEEPMDMFVAFMGRKPEITALLRQEGILEQ
ncbi:MAG: oligopeptidase A [Candidatus Pseudothioglobus sp.]|jgi:oligopeptidase A